MGDLGFYQIPKFEGLSSECEVVRSAVVDSNVGHFLRPLPNLDMNWECQLEWGAWGPGSDPDLINNFGVVYLRYTEIQQIILPENVMGLF